MSCTPKHWSYRVIQTFGTSCPAKKEDFLLPAGMEYIKGTHFILDDDNTPAGSPFPMVKVLTDVDELKECQGVFILTCDEDATGSDKPCKAQLATRGLFDYNHIPWPVEVDADGNATMIGGTEAAPIYARWGIDKIRKVANAARCCGLHYFGDLCC